MISAEEFKPKIKGRSDFYSWNLYRWLRGNKKSYLILKNDRGVVLIGEKIRDDSYLAFNLHALCCGSSTSRFPRKFWFDGCEDITEEFYAEYRRIGVCAIHGDNSHDWEVTDSGDYRICKHCEKVEVKKTKIVERVTWEDAE